MTHPEMDTLAKASEGLLYPSESDEPFEVFNWGPAPAAGPTTRDAVLRRSGKAPLQEVAVDQFFSELQSSDDADRFNALKTTLQTQLANLKIFRAGSINVDIYLIGQSPSSELVGLKTSSVET